jgi:ABC-type antimicrobial peptide transport system permease subunit
VPRAIGGLLAALGVVSLLHALLTTVARRGTDLAVLRALGLRRGGMRTVLAAEAVTIATIGLVLGVPLGVLAGRIAWWALAERLGVAPDPVLPLSGFAALFVVGVSVAAACSSVPAWLALRQTSHRPLSVE